MTSIARRWRAALVVLLAIPLLVGALELRLPEMTRPLWEDEVHHNEPVLASPTMDALEHKDMYVSMLQPKLDFWMRKALWFPALGVSERSLRMPALVWGLSLVLLVYAVVLAFFAKRIGLVAATLVAFVGALWIVDNPMEVHLAVEARSYSLIAFASTAWCASLFLFDGRPRWLLAATTLLFANTHFFALPMVAAGLALQVLREARDRRYRWIAFHLLVGVGVYLCTVRFNLAPLLALMARPPGTGSSAHAPLVALFTRAHLAAGFELWLGFSRALAVWPATWLVWLMMLVAVFRCRQTRFVPPLLAVLAGLPLFFTYMRFRSDYPFSDRYFSAFFGLGVVTVVDGIEVLRLVWQMVSPRLPADRHTLVLRASLIVLACGFGAPRFVYRLFAGATALHRVPANFSPYYRAYREIWAAHEPAFIVHNHCFATDIPRMYFTYILPRTRVAYDWGKPMGCERDTAQIKERLVQHVRNHGLVVLDQKEDDCAARPVPPTEPPVTVEKIVSDPACMWRVHGATSLADLARTGAALGFRSANTLY